jgi:hypothetical protein
MSRIFFLGNELDVARVTTYALLDGCLGLECRVTRSRWLKASATWWGVTLDEGLRDYK